MKTVGFRNFTKTTVAVNYLDRITTHPDICHGKPSIRGMRWPVEVILDLLGSEMTFADIMGEHPELEKEDILAALQFAKLSSSGKSLYEVV